MSSSRKSSKPQSPPLNRWKGRLRIFNKPTFWVSTAVLLLIGLLVADYSRVQMNQADVEKQIELAREKEEREEGDRQDPLNLAYGDDSLPPTLDGIPLPDDPELREWAIREANDLNPDSELADPALNEGAENNRQTASNPDAESQEERFELDEPARLITNDDDRSASEEDDGSLDANTRRNRRNRQNNTTEPNFQNYAKSADDVLSLMGLNTPRVQINGGDTGTLDSPTLANGSNGNALDLFTDPKANALPPSALAQALQNLAIDSSTANTTIPLSNGPTTGLSSQNTALDTATPSGQLSSTSLEGLPIFQQPLIQTAPAPGTTGYIAPPPLPTVASPGAAIAPPSTITAPGIGQPNSALGSIPSTTLAPQPTVTLPQAAAPQALPNPAFITPPPVEHTPYIGGGRNGEINTFSNP